jgi:hypothetical protein
MAIRTESISRTPPLPCFFRRAGKALVILAFLLAAFHPIHARPVAGDAAIHPQDDGSRIIVERLAGVMDIPAPPEPVAPAPRSPLPEEERISRAEKWRIWREANPVIRAGATVYRLPGGRRVTHVHYWSVNDRPSVSFWSAADFSLLAHPGEFITPEGVRYGMFLMHSSRDPGEERKIPGAQRAAPFPQEPSEWRMDPNSRPADASTLAAIQAIHAHYENNLAALKATYDKIEAERAARRAELEANPPQPRDIHLRVGRLSREQAADWHRHATRKNGGGE